MRTAAAGMTWAEICATYAPQSGPVRLGAFSCENLGLGRFEFRATLGISHTIGHFTTQATGPVSAMTQILADSGVNLEIVAFHQTRSRTGTRTFVLTERRGRRQWAMGTGADGTESACRAMVAAANLSLA